MANRHKRDLKTNRRHPAAIAGPAAALATVAAVTIGVLTTGDDTDRAAELQAIDTSQFSGSLEGVDDRGAVVSRNGNDRRIRDGLRIERKPTKAEKMMRAEAVRAAVAGADTELWTTTALNIWTRPDGRAEKLGVIEEVKKVLVTGREHLGRTEIVLDGRSRWVTAGYLDDEKPVTEEEEEEAAATEGTGGSCTNGSSVSSGVSGSIVEIHQAVCARWPEITTYGTLRDDSGDHGSGRAVDVMISGGTGWEVAEYLRANADAFGISYLIFSQKIWSVDRAGEGWRWMEDRGSTTANHYDHVHASVY